MLCAGLAFLGIVLTALGSGQPWTHAFRSLAVVGAIMATALLLDLASPARNRFLLPVAALLASLGVMLLSRIDGHLAAKQVLWVQVGCAALIATYYLVDRVSALADWKYLAGIAAVGLMLATIIWGVERNGARLWLSWSGVATFQPAEIAKLLLVIFLAGYLAASGRLRRRTGDQRVRASARQWRYLAPMVLMVLLCLGLFVGLKDLGTALLFLGLCVVMVYSVTGHRGLVVLSLLGFVLGIIVSSAVFLHGEDQIQAWLHPWEEVAGVGYQPEQGLYALAEGGVSGVGLGVLPVTAQQLPEASTDLIFAVLGQDLGLAGAVAVLLLYALLAWTGYRLAWRSGDSFAGLLATGLTSIFALQSFIIVAGVLRLLPLTSLPLPLMSYGGTSMLVSFITLGLLLAVSREQAVPEAVRGR